MTEREFQVTSAFHLKGAHISRMLTPAVLVIWFGYMALLSHGGKGGRLSLPFAITTCSAKARVGGQVKTAALFMYAVVQ
jgi:hypothetical protein